MKKFWLLGAIMLCLGLSSCLKDDDEGGGGALVGLWTFLNATVEVENPTNPEAAEEAMNDIGLATVFLQGSTIEIKPDKTFAMTVWGETQTGSYSNEGGKFILTADGETVEVDEDSFSGAAIAVKNGVLTITSDELNDEYRAEGFTKYVMKMNFKK